MLFPPNSARDRLEDSAFSSPEITVMWAAGMYYNGAPFYRDGENLQIGVTAPPSMQTLLDCPDDLWKDDYQPALESLQEMGIFRGGDEDDSEYILRRNIKYAPTRNGRGAIGDLFHEEFIDRFRDEILHFHTGLVGDWDETLTHRTMVELMVHHNILSTPTRERDQVDLTRYPGENGQVRPDLESVDGDWKWGLEAITDHNDRMSLESKYSVFQDQYDSVWWIFDTRETAVRTLSYLHESDNIDCEIVNAPFDNPGNYAVSKANEYLNRSHESADYSCEGIRHVETMQSVFDRISQFTAGYVNGPAKSRAL